MVVMEAMKVSDMVLEDIPISLLFFFLLLANLRDYQFKLKDCALVIFGLPRTSKVFNTYGRCSINIYTLMLIYGKRKVSGIRSLQTKLKSDYC